MRYISLKEFSYELSVSVDTVKNWVRLGKITPDFTDGSKMFFLKSSLKKLKKDISTGKKTYLKSRRNKKYVSGSFLYKDYLSEASKNIEIIANLINKINDLNTKINNEEIRFLIAECALQLMNKDWNLQTFLDQSFDVMESQTYFNNQGDKERYCDEQNMPVLKTNCSSELILKFQNLIEDLIINRRKAQSFIKNNPELFKFQYVYEANEDILGLLYISLSNLSDRKLRGAYYTPDIIAKKLVKNLKINYNKTLIDPCCGTGNFLLQLPDNIKLSQIYANDIDEISVQITRLNLFIKYKPDNLDVLYSNITNDNFLYKKDKKYDYIIGNPPWGAEFSETEKKDLRKKFLCAVGKNIESYDVFIEKSLKSLNKDGILAFVLPEAVMNVKNHMPIRKIIKNKCELKSLEFLGNVFNGVQCPSIIIQLQLSSQGLTGLNSNIVEKTRSFLIKTKREIFSEQFNFNCNDEEYILLEKLFADKKLYLKDNADFALGIVTGNNKEMISNVKTDENEIILKGSDIAKYEIKHSDNYIIFNPKKFQQVANEKMYRADEKLFYRFIGNKLVFAYDNSQRLSLNSCNILIPQLKDYNIKYIMAVLNSRVAQFVFSKKYNSIKVLRSHIENIPIPVCDNQSEIIEFVDRLLRVPHDNDIYNILDEKIARLYGLTSQEYELIKKSG